MVNQKTSQRQKSSTSKAQTLKLKEKPLQIKKLEPEHALRKDAKLKDYDPMKNILDTKKMGAAIMECLIDGDTEGVLEIIEEFLYAVNKTQFLKDAKIPRSTAYNVFKRRNPTIKTLAKLMHASAHS